MAEMGGIRYGLLVHLTTLQSASSAALMLSTNAIIIIIIIATGRRLSVAKATL
jgi:hypothetical protein